MNQTIKLEDGIAEHLVITTDPAETDFFFTPDKRVSIQ
jgi:hypothetical protein